MMQTVILAGGRGTRIAGIARGLPKSLIPVAGRPFIDHQLERLVSRGIRDIVLCVGVGADRIEAHVGDGSRLGARVRYSREPADHLLGTGGALVNALPLLDASFLVMYGDSYLSIDFADVAASFLASGRPAMMTVFRNEGRWDASNTRIADGRVVFYSKQARPGEADWIDYGLMAFHRAAIEAYRVRPPPLDLSRILADLVDAGAVAAHEARDRFYEIGKPEGLDELDRHLCVSGADRIESCS